MCLINLNTEEIDIGSKVRVECGQIWGMWGEEIIAFRETGIVLKQTFRVLGENSQKTILENISNYSPVQIEDSEIRGKTFIIFIFVPWAIVEKIRRLE